MLRSFVALSGVDPGFDPNGVLTFTAVQPALRHPEERQAYGNNLEEKLEAIPGVTAVTAASPLPLDGVDQTCAGVCRRPPKTGLFRQATTHIIRGLFQRDACAHPRRSIVHRGRQLPTTTGIIIDDCSPRRHSRARAFIDRRQEELLADDRLKALSRERLGREKVVDDDPFVVGTLSASVNERPARMRPFIAPK